MNVEDQVSLPMVVSVRYPCLPIHELWTKQGKGKCKIERLILDPARDVCISKNIGGDTEQSARPLVMFPPDGWDCAQYTAPAVLAYRVTGKIRIIGSMGIVIVDDCVIGESMRHNNPPKKPILSSVTQDGGKWWTELNLEGMKTLSLSGQYLSMLAGWVSNRNLTHFLFEVLSNFEFILRSPLLSLTDVGIILPYEQSPYQQEGLKVIEESIHFPNHRVHASDDSIIEVSSLIFFTGHRMTNLPRPQTAAFMRLLASNAHKCIKEDKRKELDMVSPMLYFSRKDTSPARRPLNEDEVEGLMLKKGFSVIQGSNYSVAEKMYMSSRSSFIGCQTGSGCINILFAPPGKAHLLEIQRQDFITFVHKRFCAASNQGYSCIVGALNNELIDKAKASPHLYHEWTVDTNKLESLIDVVLQNLPERKMSSMPGNL